MKVTLCDHCRKEDERFIKVRFENDNGEAAYNGDIDLCSECFVKIVDFIKGIETKTEAPKETDAAADDPKEEKPKKKSSERKTMQKFDRGKAVALREAGWSYSKIGQEFGVVPETIRAFFKKYEAENGVIVPRAYRESEWYSGSTETEHVYYEPKGKV